MLLLTGAAGSGKTHRILAEFREALRRRDPGVRLLVPTTTMAQHLQNLLAREGFVFQPALIQTLSRFVDSLGSGAPQVSEPLLYLMVEEAARRVDRPEFVRVVRTPGFCAALARTIEEFSSAGCDAERLGAVLRRKGFAAPLGEAFLAVYREVENGLRRRGAAMRSQRLLDAAAQIGRAGLGGVRTVWLDGFYALTDPELELLRAVCGRAEVTAALPAAPVTAPTRERLLAMGFVEERRQWSGTRPRAELSEAPAIEREADEIARRILEQAAAGRPFREMGIIVRSPEMYAALLRATLDRFGIPARFYFDAELSNHGLVRYLAGAVDAMLGGWDHAETLAAVRLAPGIDCDEFDFAVREQMPGAGLASLEAMARGPVTEVLRDFEQLEEWRGLELTPAEWAARLGRLREWYRPGQPAPGAYEVAVRWRSDAAALQAFGDAMDEAASALEARPIPLSEFWSAAQSVLRLTPLRVEDRRRNVVHVLGAHEARQWQLPVVFVCGLVEGQFPKFHAADPFFPEAARAELKQAGIRLRTAADFEAEERFLFDCAVTRASEALTVSYPRLDARGQQTLRSVFLDDFEAAAMPCPAVRPRPGRQGGAVRPAATIASDDLLALLAGQHAVFRPTGLEAYLQCPFQFFSRNTLRLKGAPARAEKRFSFMVEGNIIHQVLKELPAATEGLEAVFARIFRQVCEKERIPPGYRTEACRERLLADLRRLMADAKWTAGFEIRTEQEFQYRLSEGVEIKGRIDRLEVMPDGRAMVVDYKYSGAQNTRNKRGDENVLQPQLYALAAERFFGLRAAGIHYCGLRNGVTWVDLSDQLTPERRRQAIETTLRIAEEIRAGRIVPQPADVEKCARCDYRDACRFEGAAAALAEEA